MALNNFDMCLILTIQRNVWWAILIKYLQMYIIMTQRPFHFSHGNFDAILKMLAHLSAPIFTSTSNYCSLIGHVILLYNFHKYCMIYRLFKEWVSFFLGSWDMNRSAEQTNRVNREAVLVRFVCSALRFISHEPRKKDTHSLYLQCLQQRPLLKFSEQSKKFKFPAEIGHLTLFPDKTIIAYSFRQNSAWINGEKVVCCECFHTLKQY